MSASQRPKDWRGFWQHVDAPSPHAAPYETGWRFVAVMTVWAVIFLGGFWWLQSSFSQQAAAVFGMAFLIFTFIVLLVAIGLLQSRAARLKGK
ncbi:MAG TPA: hypothetical protein VEY12_11170 [Thermoplasmata archaeon]|nr:hypothetical protein [Thermoplasmata archaeon]